ncbi:Pr6Pr family membrane protein [Zhihengliuella halotolerans]|uniref:Pr6Pr family membrane protein n=1 Tax=Zhihengliuella halotolerans TaxID=370736 RepID=UPI000C7F871B|nr:Pr6Pr family membrane protein [Zhihengliuella halotolerans]
MTPAALQATRTPTLLWDIVRVVAAVLIVAAAARQLGQSVSFALTTDTAHGSHLPTVVANFLSFFTIESNLLAAAVLLVAAIRSFRARGREAQDPAWLATLLVCASTYMIVTGVVYNVLLRGIELPQGQTVPWSNEVLHVVGPLVMLLDVLLAPRRRALPWAAIGVVVLYPIAWATYTLLRANTVIAPLSGDPWWYPYPFLDPHLQGGYGVVAAYIAAIAVLISLAGWGVIAAGRRRARA